MSKKTVFKPWFGWDVAHIETYLESMALKGWQLEKVSFAMMLFRFTSGASQKLSFQVDFRPQANLEYQRLFKDDGWEHINSSAGWVMWAKPYQDHRPHIFTDNQSLLERNRRLIFIIILALLTQFPAVILSLTDSLFDQITTGLILFLFFYGLCIGFLIFGLLRLWRANSNLRQS